MLEVGKSIKKNLKLDQYLQTQVLQRFQLYEIYPHIPKNVIFIPSHPLAGTENFGPRAGLRLYLLEDIGL